MRYLILCLFFIGCLNSSEPDSKLEDNKNERFQIVSVPLEHEMSNLKSILIQNPGDLLSRLWSEFGKPSSIQFEGFDYVIYDKKSGMYFTAYFGSGGSTFGGDLKRKNDLSVVFKDFENFLAKLPNADCHIEFETDFGTIVCGSKDGQPYTREKK